VVVCETDVEEIDVGEIDVGKPDFVVVKLGIFSDFGSETGKSLNVGLKSIKKML